MKKYSERNIEEAPTFESFGHRLGEIVKDGGKHKYYSKGELRACRRRAPKKVTPKHKGRQGIRQASEILQVLENGSHWGFGFPMDLIPEDFSTSTH